MAIKLFRLLYVRPRRALINLLSALRSKVPELTEMRLMVLTNMHPSKAKPYAGLFVVNQVRAIESHLADTDTLSFFYQRRSFTSKWGSLLKYSLFGIRFIWRYIFSREKYDLIHVHFFYPTVFLALLYKVIRNRKVLLLVTFHGSDLYRRKKIGVVYRYALKKCDYAITVSDQLRKRLERHGLSCPGRTLSAGISSSFRPNQISKEFDIAFIGSFYRIKGFDIFCELLSKIDSPLKVLVIGSGHLLEEIHSLRLSHEIRILENVDQDDLARYYWQVKYLINTSREEAFGLTIAEAMACGVPALASTTDGALEQIVNGKNGFLLPRAESPNFMSEAIGKIQDGLNMSSEEYGRMQVNAIETAQRHRLEGISEEIVEIYRTLQMEAGRVREG